MKNKTIFSAVLAAVSFGFAPPLAVFAGEINRVNYKNVDSSVQKTGEIQTNADLEPSYPFTLMLITERGASGESANGKEAFLKQSLRYPRTTALQQWREMAGVREYASTDPFIVEQHPRLLSNHKTLPIVALVDSRGGDWCSLSGDSLPGSELALAKTFDAHWNAVTAAARKQSGGNVRVMSASELEKAQRPYSSRRGGPTPFKPDPPVRRPRLIPQDGLVQIPDQYDVNATTTVDPGTRTLGYVALGVQVLVAFLIGGSIVLAAAIRAFGQTDPDDEDMVIEQPSANDEVDQP